jgi:thiol-disulfide isomerase/thioredoxin
MEAFTLWRWMWHRRAEPFILYRLDRLSTVKYVFLTLLFATACNERSQQSVASSRYEAVKAVVEPASRWCDSSYTSEAPELTLPPLAAGKFGVPSPLAKKRTWVNLWATWCQPCLREMPLLLKWQDELHKDGVDVDVLFLSLDEDVPAFDAFVSKHKELAKSKVVRAASQREYAQWATSLLKDATMPIPIHMLASADGKLRCVRSGSLREGDYPAAKVVLR